MRGKQKYFTIGHITDDVITVEGKNTDRQHYLGGSAAYAAKVARELGFEAHIITKCNPDHPYIIYLRKMGIAADCLPVRDSSKSGLITSFVNAYDKNGNRTQTINHIQEEITVEDLESIRDIIIPNSIIQIAPVIDEVDPQLFTPLKDLGFLVVTPQGFFRERETGTVIRRAWDNIGCLSAAQIVILSTEDLTFADGYHDSLAKKMKDIPPVFILTKQKEGSTIFQNGNQTHEIHAFRLNPDEEKDFTGAGDTYAAAFFIHYKQHNNLQDAGVFASFYAAAKIAGLEGSSKGIDTVPSLESGSFQDFMKDRSIRVENFLLDNNASFSIFEGFISKPRKEIQ